VVKKTAVNPNSVYCLCQGPRSEISRPAKQKGLQLDHHRPGHQDTQQTIRSIVLCLDNNCKFQISIFQKYRQGPF
jgi:hypothetical protein